MIAPGTRPLLVKLILPALTEATDPYWRPIKYSLFPPLGLATLAGYLSPDDRAVIVDEHVEPLTLDDAPDLVIIQVYITNAYRAYRIADHYRSRGAFVCLGRTACYFAARRGGTARGRYLSWTRRADLSEVSEGLSLWQTGARVRFHGGPHAGARSSHSSRSDPAQRLPCTELHRRDARLPPALRFLLQGRFLPGWPRLLHAARG